MHPQGLLTTLILAQRLLFKILKYLNAIFFFFFVGTSLNTVKLLSVIVIKVGVKLVIGINENYFFNKKTPQICGAFNYFLHCKKFLTKQSTFFQSSFTLPYFKTILIHLYFVIALLVIVIAFPVKVN